MVGDTLKAQFAARRDGFFDFELHPKLWQCADIEPFYAGKAWTQVKFASPPPEAVAATSGIYMFVVAPHCAALSDHSYIFYVGQTKNLRQRYRRYLLEKECRVDHPRERVVRFLNHFEGFVNFHFTLVPVAELDRAEGLLKDNLTPYANTQLEVIGRLET